MRAALLQLCSGDDPAENLRETGTLFDRAVAEGAGFVLTPEVTNCVSTSRTRQNEVLQHESEDITLAGLREKAAKAGVWCLIGSLALKTNDPDGRFANRSFLIGPDGDIAARYDKIHMFDVQVSENESYRESDGYRPGKEAVLAETPFGIIGLTVCYDIRFPHLYRQLSLEGAEILTVPSAFSPVTGAAHWETLLRARAIENGAYVLAPTQTGEHRARRGKARKTYGHGMAVAPWGEVLADAGEEPGLLHVELDMARVVEARRRIPSLAAAKGYNGPS
ncbi:MAG: carbon-nitrogen hydrolase family protein [Roseovarius sp.]